MRDAGCGTGEINHYIRADQAVGIVGNQHAIHPGAGKKSTVLANRLGLGAVCCGNQFKVRRCGNLTNEHAAHATCRARDSDLDQWGCHWCGPPRRMRRDYKARAGRAR